MELDPKQYAWAKGEAKREWEGDEGDFHDWLRDTTLAASTDLARFHGFLDKWSVGRTLLGEAKPDVLRALVEEYRPQWQSLKAGGPEAYRSVEAYSLMIRDRGWTPLKRTPTSYASKSAFMCNPGVFAPYDSYGRKGLAKRGFRVAPNDYTAYMTAFAAVQSLLTPQISEGASQIASSCARPMSRQIAAMRILDKLLMCEGGFLPPGDLA